jgi:hypothetical protein
VDPHGARQVNSFAPSMCAVPRDRALAAFQDGSSGRDAVRVQALASGGGRRGSVRTVSATPRRAGNQWRPRLACSRGRVLALWEDQRDGPAQIYRASVHARRLR